MYSSKSSRSAGLRVPCWAFSESALTRLWCEPAKRNARSRRAVAGEMLSTSSSANCSRTAVPTGSSFVVIALLAMSPGCTRNLDNSLPHHPTFPHSKPGNILIPGTLSAPHAPCSNARSPMSVWLSAETSQHLYTSVNCRTRLRNSREIWEHIRRAGPFIETMPMMRHRARRAVT
jgi:hypothetical protein